MLLPPQHLDPDFVPFLPLMTIFLSSCCCVPCWNDSLAGIYFSDPALIPGWSRISIWLSSILFRIASVKRLKIYSTLVPFLADASIKGIFLSLANRRPYSKVTFLLKFNPLLLCLFIGFISHKNEIQRSWPIGLSICQPLRNMIKALFARYIITDDCSDSTSIISSSDGLKTLLASLRYEHSYCVPDL